MQVLFGKLSALAQQVASAQQAMPLTASPKGLKRVESEPSISPLNAGEPVAFVHPTGGKRCVAKKPDVNNIRVDLDTVLSNVATGGQGSGVAAPENSA